MCVVHSLGNTSTHSVWLELRRFISAMGQQSNVSFVSVSVDVAVGLCVCLPVHGGVRVAETGGPDRVRLRAARPLLRYVTQGYCSGYAAGGTVWRVVKRESRNGG